jgi:sensor histidine kinase regulating citrate/malate metabolism
VTRLSVDLVLQDDLWGPYKVVRDIANGSGDAENVVVYATVLDPQGRVLAHSDPTRHPMGERLDLTDQPSIPTRAVVLSALRGREGEHLYDVAAPIVLDNRHIGVARVGITTCHLEATVARMTRNLLLISSLLGAFGVGLGLVISRRMVSTLDPVRFDRAPMARRAEAVSMPPSRALRIRLSL